MWYVWSGTAKQKSQMFKCEKCNKQPFSHYMVKDELWPEGYGLLCLNCWQDITGRKITINDFKPCGMTNLIKLGFLLSTNQDIDLKDF